MKRDQLASSSSVGAFDSLPTYLEFADLPEMEDYLRLADHLDLVGQDEVHPALFPQRAAVAINLRRMAEVPNEAAHRSAYHTLRLFIF